MPSQGWRLGICWCPAPPSPTPRPAELLPSRWRQESEEHCDKHRATLSWHCHLLKIKTGRLPFRHLWHALRWCLQQRTRSWAALQGRQVSQGLLTTTTTKPAAAAAAAATTTTTTTAPAPAAAAPATAATTTTTTTNHYSRIHNDIPQDCRKMLAPEVYTCQGAASGFAADAMAACHPAQAPWTPWPGMF